MLNAIPDPVAIVDREGKMLAVNDKLAETTGFEREALLKTSLLGAKSLTAASRKALAKNLAKRMSGMPVAPYEIEFSAKDGKRLSFEVNARRIEYAGRITSLVVLRDTTLRKAAEEALRRSEEKYRMVAENSPQGIVVVRDRIIYANDAFAKIFGYTTEELLALSPDMVLESVHPEDRELVWSRFRKRLAEEAAPSRYECRGVRRDGTTIWLELFAHRIVYEGQPAVHGVVVDLTSRRQAEEKLRRSEEKFRNIFETADDCMIHLDSTGKILDVNRKTLEVFGGAREELVGKHFSEVGMIVPGDMPRVRNAFAQNLAGDPHTLNIHVTSKDGHELIFEASGSLVKSGDGVTVMVAARDVTERKRMEEQLKHYSQNLEELVRKKTNEVLESEKTYSVLIEEASDGVALIQDRRMVLVNKRAVEIGGYSKDEMVGAPFVEFLDEGSRAHVQETYARRLRGEEVPSTYELRLKRKTGEAAPVEVSVKLIEYQGRPAVFAFVRDISERKQTERESLRLERLAAIGELAMMVGHDLRNPLQSIRNATYYLINEYMRARNTQVPEWTHTHAKASEMLHIINNSVDYADKIVRDLQDYSLVRRPLLETVDVNVLVKAALSQVSVPENVKLATNLSSLPQIEVDKDMMYRVFLNLAVNGIHAITNEGTLEVSTKRSGRSIEIKFKDTGVGIPKRHVTQIFEPFFTTKAKGLGMGLPICKKFAESHGGNIDVESEEGKGSTFTVRLPTREEMKSQ